jgi:Mitochondrial biogenesis AIM24
MTMVAGSVQRLMRRSPLAASRLCCVRRHTPALSIATTKLKSSYAVSTNQFRPLSTSSNQPVEARASKDGVVGFPIDFDVAAKIEGNESQIVTVALKPGQVLRAESGAMMYMTSGVTMNTTTGGGLSSGFQRMLTGQNFFISDYTYEGEPGTVGHVALGTDFPSKIVRLNIEEYGGKLVCQKGALLCASHTVDIQMEFSKNFSTGFFGGEGFVLQGMWVLSVNIHFWSSCAGSLTPLLRPRAQA